MGSFITLSEKPAVFHASGVAISEQGNIAFYHE